MRLAHIAAFFSLQFGAINELKLQMIEFVVELLTFFITSRS